MKNNSLKNCLLFGAPLAAALSSQVAAAQTPSRDVDNRPNIILFISDDCTYRDLNPYGGVNVQTTNINRLAEEGIRFTNFFQAAPVSSPTRQCLMTGLYPMKSGAYPNHARVNDDVISVVQQMRAQGYRVALQAKRHFEPLTVFDYEFLSGGNDDVNIDKIRPFIKDCTSKGQPFVLFVCSHQPHTPWNMGDPSKIDPDALVLPSYYVDTPETRFDYRNYLAEVKYMDDQVGAVDALIDECGIRDNTVFFYTSEQGNALPFAKWTLYDMGVQTAMIVRWPGVIKPGSVTDAMGEYVDVVPTFIEIAGGRPDYNYLEGRSFLPVLKGRTNRHKSEVYAQATSRGVINGPDHYGIRSVRNERYVYVRNLTPDELFRCENCDPGKHAYWA
ncbi:MAG: sulfatase, partial [Bacteroidales bacterium]|nr:sulfatase [Bacteroidales bacterium]